MVRLYGRVNRELSSPHIANPRSAYCPTLKTDVELSFETLVTTILHGVTGGHSS
jgi:hypothetical protein